MKKTERQPKAPTTAPPSIGPATAATPMTVMNSPSDLPRSRSGNTSVTMAMPLACTMAAPTLWNILDRTTSSSVGEEPASAAPTANMPSPAVYTRLRPTMSDSLPMGSSRELVARMYPTTTHCTSGMVAEKWSAMRGSARLTLVWSSTDMNMPTATAPKAHHL